MELTIIITCVLAVITAGIALYIFALRSFNS
jgi:hypothetical protein